jgi:hypothetical protein
MIADEQRYRCALCGSLFLGGFHIDHKRPQYQGGTSDRWNLWALCIICHGRKTAMEQSLRVAAARAAADPTAGQPFLTHPQPAPHPGPRLGPYAPPALQSGLGPGLVPGLGQGPGQGPGPGPGPERATQAPDWARAEVRQLADWDGPFVFQPTRTVRTRMWDS